MKTAENSKKEQSTLEMSSIEVCLPENDIPAPAVDFFSDLENLRVSSNGTEEPIVETVLTHVPVRKPSREWFFRIHPQHVLETLVLELKDEGDTLLVDRSLREALVGEKCVDVRLIRLGVNRQGTPFLWPMRKPAEGRKDAWALTAVDAAREAESRWTRVQADMSLGAYRLAVAKVDDVPRWPKESFNDLLRIGFKGAVVDSLDHPVLKKLRGEV
jgi:hypothetical protein